MASVIRAEDGKVVPTTMVVGSPGEVGRVAGERVRWHDGMVSNFGSLWWLLWSVQLEETHGGHHGHVDRERDMCGRCRGLSKAMKGVGHNGGGTARRPRRATGRWRLLLEEARARRGGREWCRLVGRGEGE